MRNCGLKYRLDYGGLSQGAKILGSAALGKRRLWDSRMVFCILLVWLTYLLEGPADPPKLLVKQRTNGFFGPKHSTSRKLDWTICSTHHFFQTPVWLEDRPRAFHSGVTCQSTTPLPSMTHPFTLRHCPWLGHVKGLAINDTWMNRANAKWLQNAYEFHN